MTDLEKFLSSNSEDPKMEAFSENLINTKLDRDRRKKYQSILENKYQIKRETQVSKIRTFSSKTLLAVAASAVLLLGLFYFTPFQSDSNLQQLVSLEIEDLQIMSDQSVMRKGPAEFEELRKSANQHYANKNYSKALVDWDLLNANQETKDRDYFYMAICHLKLDQAQLAKEHLEKIQNAADLQQEKQWVSALILLKLNELDNAKVILNNISNQSTFMSDQAAEILGAL